MLASGSQLGAVLLLGGVVACGHIGSRATFVGCVVGEGGQIRYITGGRTGGQYQPGPYVGGGVRVGVKIPLASPFYLQAVADALAVTKYGFTERDTGPAVVRVGMTSGVAGGVGAGLGASF